MHAPILLPLLAVEKFFLLFHFQSRKFGLTSRPTKRARLGPWHVLHSHYIAVKEIFQRNQIGKQKSLSSCVPDSRALSGVRQLTYRIGPGVVSNWRARYIELKSRHPQACPSLDFETHYQQEHTTQKRRGRLHHTSGLALG